MKLPKTLIALVSSLSVGAILAFVGVDLAQCGETSPTADAGVQSPADAGVASDEDAGE